MSKPVFRLTDSSKVQAVPRGELLKGWIPGTIVGFVPSTDGKYLHVNKAHEKTTRNGACGFLINGSYFLGNGFPFSFPNGNEPSGRWTADEVVANSKGDENDVLEYDETLSWQGNGMTTVNYDGGCFKVYTFERYDKEYLSSNGERGGEIDWDAHVGELLGCSSRSLFTTSDNNVLDSPIEYRLGGKFSDDDGEYIYIVRN